MTEKIIKRQRQTVIKAMRKADLSKWPYGMKVKLDERMATRLCIELLVDGFMVLGEGNYVYTIQAMKNANIEKYSRKVKGKT